jgi:hypothetical protein
LNRFQSQEDASRLVRTKLGDEKSNEKFLKNIKQAFAKRITEVKSGY